MKKRWQQIEELCKNIKDEKSCRLERDSIYC